MDKVTLINNDCFAELERLQEKSVDLCLIDPPYNISVTSRKNNKTIKNDWDKIDDYEQFCARFISAAHRVLKDNGVMYIWHSELVSISKIIQLAQSIGYTFVSFCIWNKGDSFRAQSWHLRDPDSSTAPRSWFNTCEYCLHFFKVSKTANAWERHTGLERVYSDPNCFRPLKEWYASELKRLNLTDKIIGVKYTEVIGKKPFMLRHYFKNNQFVIPTERVYNAVYKPLGFNKTYEALRQEYEALRHYHRCDEYHNNVWNVPPIPTQNRFHTCQKPVDILRRIIRVSSPPDGVVLDFFMGSGSTGVAAVKEGRRFIGIEKDEGYFKSAQDRIEAAKKEPDQITFKIPMTQRRPK